MLGLLLSLLYHTQVVLALTLQKADTRLQDVPQPATKDLLASSTNEDSTLCRIAGHEINPIVESLATFFNGRNIVIYPFALTMVAAMRWGGIGVVVKDKSFVLDHDLDFFVAMSNVTYPGMQKVLHEWQLFLKNRHKLASFDGGKFTFGNPLLSESGIIRGGEFYHTFITVERKSPVGTKLKEDEAIVRTFDKVHALYAGNSSDHYILPVEQARPENNPMLVIHSDRSWADVKSQLVQEYHASDWYQEGYTMVDFWYQPERELSEGLLASLTKKTLFMGQTFPFPSSTDAVYQGMKVTFPRDHPAFYQTSGLCDFRESRSLFEEDLPSSPETSMVLSECTSRLSSKSFASFQYCKP